MAALPWAADAPAPPRDAMREASANLALLSAARAISRTDPDATEHLEAEAVVAHALTGMTPEARLAAASAIRNTQERIYQVLRTLHDGTEGPITADDVLRLLSSLSGDPVKNAHD